MQNSESSFVQRQVMITEAMVDGRRSNEKDGKDEEHLCLFGKSIYVNIYYTFLDYRPFSSKDYIRK